MPLGVFRGPWGSLGVFRGSLGVGSDAEALGLAVDVAQPQVDVGAHALQGLQAQRAAQVLSVGSGRRQPEAEAVGGFSIRERRGGVLWGAGE